MFVLCVCVCVLKCRVIDVLASCQLPLAAASSCESGAWKSNELLKNVAQTGRNESHARLAAAGPEKNGSLEGKRGDNEKGVAVLGVRMGDDVKGCLHAFVMR